LEIQLELPVPRQPDPVSCGPTCLQAIYRYYGDDQSLDSLGREVEMLESGGTLAVLLACHALARGYRATLYSYNLRVFDPTWFALDRQRLRERLVAEREVREDERLASTIGAYVRFLDLGGEARFDELSGRLLRRLLDSERPILTGLSATYLYRDVRERPSDHQDDDLRGEPVGHFVVLSGYDRTTRRFLVSDPYHPNPLGSGGTYEVGLDRLLGAIFLGTLTWDGNLLVLAPRGG